MATEREGTVVFRPEIENLRNDRQRAWFGNPRLLDLGDQVEYFDGKRSHHWRLPGQTAELPQLSRVLVAGVRFPVSSKIANYTVGFYGSDGELLGRVSFRPRLNWEQFEAMLPDSAFEGLLARGVQVERVTYNDGPHLYREHPEFSGGTAERRFMQHPARWIAAAIVVLVVVVNLVLVANGYYS
ncbi:MAG TPA: hypothetical protein VHO01_06905 [Jatrophihabitans sp.]|nr:hypothetical protein [Jatrophihabitans sp.]